jgi:phosphonate metabolism protein PhnN/1,5-bisphosphokinase (PRPP-forming)
MGAGYRFAGGGQRDAGDAMLVLIVGPSGAGKDTLLNVARVALRDDKRIRFVRRAITRPPDPTGEDHESVDERTFEARRAAGVFALSWRAHGLQYGIPADIAVDLAAGRVPVASISRASITDAAARFPLRVIEVTAPADMLARRLAARGREDAVDIARRLSRTVPLPAGLESETLVNDGTIEQGGRKMVAALLRAAEASGA